MLTNFPEEKRVESGMRRYKFTNNKEGSICFDYGHALVDLIRDLGCSVLFYKFLCHVHRDRFAFACALATE